MQNEEPNMNIRSERPGRKHRGLGRHWDRAAVGLALIWGGTAWLLGLGWYAALTGVGAILLVEQVLRWRGGLPADGFWALAGIVAVTAGIAGLAGHRLPVMALVLIVAGLMLLGSVVRPGKRQGV
ncbi:MAG: hypothetical protein JJT90_18735 [Ectothiorhodospiraceae bacterium]|nr:hypothetical protein [Ectothiorhodospiraceae bacterium]